MTTARQYDGEGLTVDAKIAGAPLEGEKSSLPPEPEAEYKPVEEEIEESVPTSYKVNGSKKRPRAKKLGNGPVANIINIANCNGVQIGKSITYNIQRKESREESEKKQYQKTETIAKLLNCPERANEDDIMFVSTHVGEGWRDIGRKLKYSEGQIYQFDETHRIKGIKEVVYQMLLDWIQNEPEIATLGKLCTVLWETQQEEVVHLLSTKLIL